jgi:hypothetical protein
MAITRSKLSIVTFLQVVFEMASMFTVTLINCA